MKTSLLLLAAGGLLLTGCNQNQSGATGGTNSAAASTNHGSFATAPVDYLSTAANAEHSMNKTIDVSYLNEALSQFNVQEGRYPKTLQELVPNYVSKLPPTPYGYKLDYNATSGTVKVVPQ